MRMNLRRFLFAVLLPLAGALADDLFPRADWQETVSPLASPHAVPGGEISYYAGPYPKSLNFYLEFSTGAQLIFNNLYENLLVINPVTLEFEPWLAHSWIIGEDHRTFTFHLDPKARWSDGQPLTAEDVVWTFAAILNPTNLTGPWKIDLERFEMPQALDEHTVRFQAKSVHWKNLLALSSLYILPKHVMATSDFNTINFDLPVVSGLYELGRIKEGLYTTLERRSDWWRRDYPAARGLGNFQTIRLRYYMGDESAFADLKQGRLDYMLVGSARRWVTELNGDKFERGWIVRQRVQNHNPVGFGGLAMNARKPLFADLRVRRALAHLMDREKLNRTIMYDQYTMHRSYYEGLYSAALPCTNAALRFDPARAKALLEEAGWQPDGKTGMMMKGGQPFAFTFLARDASENKFLVIFQQDLEKAGIRMKIELKDWSAWMKAMDEFDFDMTWCNYSGSLFNDPESMWSSKEADRPAGQNVCAFKDAQVDNLIERMRGEFDVKKRRSLLRELDSHLTAQVPYILLWYLDYTRIIYWNKFGMPPHVLGAINDEQGALNYWWYDADAAAELKAARAKSWPLPRPPFAVNFDEVYP